MLRDAFWSWPVTRTAPRRRMGMEKAIAGAGDQHIRSAGVCPQRPQLAVARKGGRAVMRGRQHGCLHGVAKVGDCLRLSAALSIATEHGRKVFVLDHKYQALSVVARSGVSGEHKRGRRAARELITHGVVGCCGSRPGSSDGGSRPGFAASRATRGSWRTCSRRDRHPATPRPP